MRSRSPRPAPIASEALVRIAALYAIEAEISRPHRRRAPAGTPAAHQAAHRCLASLGSKPSSPRSRAKFDPSPRRSATRSSRAGNGPRSFFLADGPRRDRPPTSSNVPCVPIAPSAERNHLFAGSDGGGVHWAVIASLIETCKMNDVDPQAYLRDVLTKIVARHPMSRIDELLPFAYRPAQVEKSRGLTNAAYFCSAFSAVSFRAPPPSVPGLPGTVSSELQHVPGRSESGFPRFWRRSESKGIDFAGGLTNAWTVSW